jgi:hypothetical protein
MVCNETAVILHLTDLHFGRDHTEDELSARKLALDGLLNQIRNVEEEWKPNVICITGDIAYRGQSSEYGLAARWVKDLLDALHLAPGALFCCPGNHDVAREHATGLARPSSADEADQILGLPIRDHYTRVFQVYCDFCKSLGIPPYAVGEAQSQLVGERIYAGTRFVALNSAWCSKDDEDKGKLWVGLPQIKYLEAKGQLPSEGALVSSTPTVILNHHPREWLHPDEYQALGMRPNTLDYVARRSHLILTGHTHGEPRRADRIAESAWHLTGGATYAEAAYYNSFRIIRVEPDKLVYRSHQYDPRETDHGWAIKGGAVSLPLGHNGEQARKTDAIGASERFAKYREKAVADAYRLIESKSRILKARGQLPETVPLKIGVHAAGLRQRSDKKQNLKLQGEPQELVILPPHEAIRKSRRTLFLGDLGTGKSTIAAQIVSVTLQENKSALAFVVPAKALALPPEFTLTQLLDEFSRYFNQQMAPTEVPISLGELLGNPIEVTIILDALDEIPRARATRLLKQFGTLVDHWPNVQTIATGRPVELSGVSYEDWQIASTLPLTKEEKFRFFHAEAIAEGNSDEEALEISHGLMAKLETSPRLDALASSPLTARLMFSRLSQIEPENEPTLGDLLCDVVKTRLGAWARMDTKTVSFPLFEQSYPDEESRAALLGGFLLGWADRTSVSLDEGRQRLRQLTEQPAQSRNAAAIAEEALRFFEVAGFLNVGDELQVSPQVFLEVLCAYGMVANWQASAVSASVRIEQWRSVSFAATILRRRGLIERFRDNLVNFLKALMRDREGTAAGAYIVTESRDVVCAKAFVGLLKGLGVRPLTFLSEDSIGSSRAIAESLKLAGQDGFDWFFDTYLDPRYPFVFGGSALTEAVFAQWASLSIGAISEHERKKLTELVGPHLETQTLVHSIVPRLATLVPEAFALERRLWFAGTLLFDPLFQKHARGELESQFRLGNRDLVDAVLLRVSEAGYASAAPAAKLWLTLDDRTPTPVILKALTRAVPGIQKSEGTRVGIAECISKMGIQKWKAFLRWSLYDADTHLAVGSAIELYDIGEGNLYLLGESLLHGLHEGGYVPRAEEILGVLIDRGGMQATVWLAEHVAALQEDFSGSHPGHWRLLLRRMPILAEKGPTVLAHCIGSISEFALPRYPEIRQLFRDLFTGDRGGEFRLALRGCLSSPYCRTRRAAAAVLVACDPRSNGEDLRVAIQSVEIAMEWHEWVHFLLTRSFDPAILIYIKSIMPQFTSKAKALALAILRRNAIQVEEPEAVHLLEWLPQIVYSDAAEYSDPVYSGVLTRLVATKHSASAARLLLRYHHAGLATSVKAACVVLLNPWESWVSIPLEEQIKNIQQDSEFAAAVERNSADIVARGGQRPLIDCLRQAVKDDAGWQAVVWSALCDDSFGPGWTELEIRGHWLLDYARRHPAHSALIGKAAHRLLSDGRVASQFAAERRQWLALLANEFSNLTVTEMAKELVVISPLCFVTPALIARVGHIPTSFQRHRFPDSIPDISSLTQPPAGPRLSVAKQLELLKNLARQSNTFHPLVCQVLSDLILQTQVSDSDLADLSGEGVYGKLIASGLVFVGGGPPRAEHFVPILSLRLNYPGQNDQCLQHLIRAWRGSHYGALEEDPSLRESYIRFLEERLSVAGGEVGPIAAKLLDLRGHLTAQEAGLVLEHNATFPGYNDLELNIQLIRWLGSDLGSDLRRPVLEALEKGLTLLDQQRWESGHFYALTYLLYPLGYWVLSGKSTEQSVRRFLLGLKHAFLEVGQSHDELRARTLAAIYPLMAKVPPAIIEEALRFGRAFDDDVVRTICYLLTLPNQGD